VGGGGGGGGHSILQNVVGRMPLPWSMAQYHFCIKTAPCSAPHDMLQRGFELKN